jgi:DNA-binding transcriptional LysR family regulator
MINVENLRTFYYIATFQSLSEAAIFLKMNKSSASRQLRALEQFLKKPLFVRSSHHLKLTTFGSYLFEKARFILFELKAIEENLLENQDEVSGIFRLTATHALVVTWLTYFLHEFVELYPNLRFEIIGSNTPLDLQNGEIDAAVRPYMKNAPLLTQIPLMRWRLSLFATPKYLEQFGTPEKVEDLDNHRLIVFHDEDAQFLPTYCTFPLHVGTKDATPRKPFIRINSVPGMYNLIERDIGIGCLAKDSLHFKNLELVPVLPDLVSSEVEVYYIYPENFQHLKKIRAFGDFLQQKVKQMHPGNQRGV